MRVITEPGIDGQTGDADTALATVGRGEYVYLVGPIEGCYKIGVSKNPERRVGQIGLMLPVDLTVVHFIQSFRAGWLEKYLHAAFRHRRVRGEWFRLTTEEQAMIRGVLAVDTAGNLPADVLALYSQNRATKPCVAFYVDPELLDALRRYVAAQPHKTPEAAVLRDALRIFLESAGYWPPKGE